MKTQQQIKTYFNGLPLSEQNALLSELLLEQELKGKLLKEASQELKQKRKKKPCPHCSSNDVYRRGKQNNVPMYSCKACEKWYSETTGTALYDIKLKDKWQSYLRCMEQGLTIKASAEKVGIAIQTSFDWRHKILSSLDQFTPDKLAEEIECDELELPINEKGNRNLDRNSRKRGTDFKRNQGKDIITTVQVVTAVSRAGGKILKAVETKRLTSKQIGIVLDNKIEDNSTLITDKHPSYKLYLKENSNIKHKRLLAKDHVDNNDKSLHLQNVNSTHSHLRSFLRKFNGGVSSKYLQNYLNWFAYMKKLQNSKTMLKQWFLAMLISDTTYSLYEMFKDNAVLIRI